MLSWEPPEDDGNSAISDYEYRLYRRTAWISTGSTNTTYTVAGLDNGTTYVFDVRALNRIGHSQPSNRVEATPMAPEPDVFTLDFAHFANGGGITSEVVLLNVGTTPIQPVLYFSDQQGEPLDAASVVEVTDDLEVADDGGLMVQAAMNPLGERTISTHGRGELVSGSVQVVAEDVIGGVLRYGVPGVGVTGVGSGAAVRDALFPARRKQGGIRTAAALHNLGEEAIELTCRLMSGGEVLEEVAIPLEANGQSSWFIEGAFPMTDTTDFAGTVRCTAPRQRPEERRFTGLAVEVDAANRIFTTLPVAEVGRTDGEGGPTVLHFAHFANGGNADEQSIRSELVFVNVQTEASRPATLFSRAIPASRPEIYFYDQQGRKIDPESVVDVAGDLEVTEDGALTVETEMAPLGELTVATHGTRGRGERLGEGGLGGRDRRSAALPRAGGGSDRSGRRRGGAGRAVPGAAPAGRDPHGGGAAQPGRGSDRADVPVDERGRGIGGGGDSLWRATSRRRGSSKRRSPATDTTDFTGTVRCTGAARGVGGKKVHGLGGRGGRGQPHLHHPAGRAPRREDASGIAGVPLPPEGHDRHGGDVTLVRPADVLLRGRGAMGDLPLW